MAGENNSVNMSLPIPGVGVTEGPQWATDVNSCLTIIDAHDHTAGSGLLITPLALNINADLSFGANNILNPRSVRLATNSTPISDPNDKRAVYSAGVDLYYNDGNGIQIQLTTGGVIAGVPGNIAGLVPPASAAYDDFGNTFVWKSDAPANVAASMDFGLAVLRNLVPNAPGLTLAPAVTMASDIAITFPAALPAATAALLMDTSGNIVPSPAKYLAFCPTGVILPFGGTAIPAGWLYCNGASVSRTTYADLFAVIGTAYGTASGTTFNLPDMRGLFMRGVSDATGRDPNAAARGPIAAGGNTGNNVGSYQGNATKVNGLSIVDPGHTHLLDTYDSANSNGGRAASANSTAVQTIAGAVHYGTANLSLDSTDLETRPENIYVNYIVKI